MEQGPTEPHAGHSTFLLSSGGAGGGYYLTCKSAPLAVPRHGKAVVPHASAARTPAPACNSTRTATPRPH